MSLDKFGQLSFPRQKADSVGKLWRIASEMPPPKDGQKHYRVYDFHMPAQLVHNHDSVCFSSVLPLSVFPCLTLEVAKISVF